MEKVYYHIKKALDKKEEIVVARILETSGSVPRKAGTTMMLDALGSFYGTVGGGAAEKEAQVASVEAMKTKKSFVKDYTSCHGSTAGDGMICGGSLRIEFTYVNEDNQEFREKFQDILDAVQKATIQVWIAGAGHVAQALVPVLSSLSFDCHVMDDREGLLTSEIFPDAQSLNLLEFKNIPKFIEEHVKERDFVCIMTKGHKDDYITLVPALRSPAYYVGLMGSRSKINALYQALRKEGFTEEEIKRCRSPIGIKISAETPLEVAYSVAGELIYTRAVLEGRNKY